MERGSDQSGCLQCGRCCERWGWNQRGTVEDLVPWIREGRIEILRHVGIRLKDGTRTSGIDLSLQDLPEIQQIDYWQHPDGRRMHSCPFFRRSPAGKAFCGIHEYKPAVCRDFMPWKGNSIEFAGNCPACRERSP